jgi:hypothetical protein
MTNKEYKFRVLVENNVSQLRLASNFTVYIYQDCSTSKLCSRKIGYQIVETAFL